MFACKLKKFRTGFDKEHSRVGPHGESAGLLSLRQVRQLVQDAALAARPHSAHAWRSARQRAGTGHVRTVRQVLQHQVLPLQAHVRQAQEEERGGGENDEQRGEQNGGGGG